MSELTNQFNKGKHMKRITAIVALALLAGCSQPETAERVLSEAGYTDIKTQGYGWLECGKDDFFHTSFTAKGPTGKHVKGVVCSGMFFKGSTIRIS